MDTIENKLLLAKFMEFNFDRFNNDGVIEPKEKTFFENYGFTFSLEELKFDTDWNWLMTSCFIFIVVFVIGQIIDNLRVAINMTLIFIAFLISGCVVYEIINYIYKKVKSKDKRIN
jgi:hypothetical protein